MRGCVLRACVLSAVVGSAALGQGHPVEPAGEVARPAVFSDIKFADGLAANKTSGKVFVVKATAVWCGPCKAMNRTTMVDPKVVKWFGDNGTIIEFDVDKDKELAQTLSISAMPTAVAFKNGKEFDRVVGLRPADSFIEWLDNVKAGKKAGDDLQVKIEKANAGEGKVTIHERLDNARALLDKDAYDKATEEYLWLWRNIAVEEPAMMGVRGSFMAGDIKRLVAKHPPAKEQFKANRDESWAAFSGGAARSDSLDDWVVLNDALDESDKTLEWFDKAKADTKAAGSIERVAFRLERLLTEKGRIVDICRLYPDPIAKLRNDEALRHTAGRLADPDQAKLIKEIQDRMFRERVGTLYTSLLLAKRNSDAEKFAAEATRLDDSEEMRGTLARGKVGG